MSSIDDEYGYIDEDALLEAFNADGSPRKKRTLQREDFFSFPSDGAIADILRDSTVAPGLQAVIREVLQVNREDVEREWAVPLSAAMGSSSGDGGALGGGDGVRTPRGPREPRKRKPGEWNEDLSDTENVLVQKKRRFALQRRRQRAPEVLKPWWQRKKESVPVRKVGWASLPDRWTKSSREQSLPTKRIQKITTVQRRGGSLLNTLVSPLRGQGMIPSVNHPADREFNVRKEGHFRIWPEDRHKYSKLSFYDGAYHALESDILFPWKGNSLVNVDDYEDDVVDDILKKLCSRCGGEHMAIVCPKVVDMASLFSFMI